jgi:N-acetylmuramoyl-L-alanine amidase
MHYSATYEDQNVQPETIRQWHIARGWSDIGYHFVITQDGIRHFGRKPETATGAHVGGHNTNTIGVCVTGGLSRQSGASVGVDTRNSAQISEQISLLHELLGRHPKAVICGHRDLGSTQCPGYDAGAWWRRVNGDAEASVQDSVGGPTLSYHVTQRGSRGRAVNKLQAELVRLGYLQGPADGKFGRLTEAAVRSFQRDSGIDVDGEVGPMTWTALMTRA